MTKFSDSDKQKIANYYSKGLSQRDIGAIMGFTGQAIGKAIRELGVETNVGGYREKRSAVREKHERIMNLYEAGKSAKEIARMLNMSQSVVIYVINKYSN